MSGGKTKIGEVVQAAVSAGIHVKLSLGSPEEIKTGYPVIVEGEKYDFYSIVMDVYNPGVPVVDAVATSPLGKAAIPAVSPGMQTGYLGNIFYSKALLEPIQIIDKKTSELGEVETIPQYFAEVRFATAEDVKAIYQPTRSSMPIGNLRGIPEFSIPIDFEKLTEKSFAILGRTGMGKSFLNKIICNFILQTGVASVFVFDMHGEYGMFSSTDNSRGLKFYFPQKVEWFTLDPKRNREATPFFIDPQSITPEDLILALPDLSQRMQDAIWEINKGRRENDLLTAIKLAESGDTVPESTLHGLQARIARLERMDFVKPAPKTMKEDPFNTILRRVKESKSIVLDFGKYGKDSMVYLFVANVISRRLHEIYTDEKGEDLPRLVIFLEEAHKFLDPKVADLTIFSVLAREMRKFNLVVVLIDQRPSRIDDEIMSQLGNRMILSLKESKDLDHALSGLPKASVWSNIVQTIPARTALIVGDAVRVPTVIEIMDYSTIQEHLEKSTVGKKRLTAEDIGKIAKGANKIISSGD
jgi:DNA helicase HerA-like ATPase